MIVAGSDTTSATITHLMYHLALEPALVTKLRGELSTAAPGDSKFLAALINETLRLHPPVPSGVLRQTPPEGLRFGSTFVPGGVTVSTPIWSLGHCEYCNLNFMTVSLTDTQTVESAFPRPNEFIPERWTTSPELLVNKVAFIPFSTGVLLIQLCLH